MDSSRLTEQLDHLENNCLKLQDELNDQQRQIRFIRAKLHCAPQQKASEQTDPLLTSTPSIATPPPLPQDTPHLVQKENTNAAAAGDYTNTAKAACEASSDRNSDDLASIQEAPTSTYSAQSDEPVRSEKFDPPKTVKSSAKSLELHFGRVWLVRLGILSILTGLIFLSNYAYQNWVAQWGAMPRLITLYLISALFIGLGSFFEKKKQALRNYGRVITGGGLAILYYTSFAAHHIERLKVIDSPLLGGLLLLVSAGLCLGYSLWKKSEITATISIALAFYATSVIPVGGVGIISSLLLTATGIYLLGKMKSLSIGFTTLIGAYATYTYWHGFVHQSSDLWLLACYWLLGSVATLFHKDTFKTASHHLFSSLNNTVFFALLSIDFSSQLLRDPLWPFALGFAGLLFGISVFMRQTKNYPSSLVSSYLAQALTYLTLGTCLWLDGPNLIFALIIKSTTLLSFALRGPKERSSLLLGFSGATSILAILIYIDSLVDISALQHGIISSLYLLCALVAFYLSKHKATLLQLCVRAIPSLLSSIALALCIVTLECSDSYKILYALVATTLLTGLTLIPKKKNPFPLLVHCSHLHTVVAALVFIELGDYPLGMCAAFTSLLALTTAIICYTHPRDSRTVAIAPIAYLALTTCYLAVTLHLSDSPSLFLLGLGILPILYHWIGDLKKLISFTSLGIGLHMVVWFYFLNFAIFKEGTVPQLSYGLVVLISFIHYTLIRLKQLSALPQLSGFLLIGATLLIHIWLPLQTEYWPLYTALIGLGYLALEESKKITALTPVAITTMIIASIGCHSIGLSFLLCYAVSLSPLAGYFIFRNPLIPRSIQSRKTPLATLAVISSLAIWHTATQHTTSLFGAGSTSICWALVGFLILTLGLFIKDKTFRTMGFIILGFCAFHVYVVDVWKLNTLLRIFSFITLGVVLLITGYLYCKKVEEDKEDTNEP